MQITPVYEDTSRRNDHFVVSCSTRRCHQYGMAIYASYYYCPACGRDTVAWPVRPSTEWLDDE